MKNLRRKILLQRLETSARRRQAGRGALSFAQLLAQLPAKIADLFDPDTRQGVHPALQLREQNKLNGQHGQRGGTQDRVLNEHEQQNGEKRATLQNRQGQDFGREAADGFHFLCEYWDDLALLGRLRIRAPPPIDQQPEASEKPLRRIALEDVERVFDESVQADRQQIQPAKQQQEYDLIQTLAQNLDRESRGFQRIVHDLLGQFQGQIQDRKREKAQHDHLRLLPSGVAQDRAEQPGIKPPHVVHARDRFCRAAPEPQDTAQDEIEGDADQQSRRQDQKR